MNTIEKIEKYSPLLDEKYRVETTSSVLDAEADTVRHTESANTVLLPMMTLDGLGDYSRTNGFAAGDVAIEYKPYTFSCDRGRMFTVDAFDDEETAAVAFGKLAGEFIATKVAPELDAYRYAKYASAAIVDSKTYSAVTLSTADIVDEIDEAIASLDDAEVPEADRYLFMSAAAYNALKTSTASSQRINVTEVDKRVETYDGIPIIKVPKSRMYTEFKFLSGIDNSGNSGTDESGGGFKPTDSAKQIHFLLMSKKATMQVVKAAKLKVVTPEQNPDADAYKFGYRLYHDTFVPENKGKGIYACVSE